MQGNRIREIRKSAKLTMEQFGEKIGVTKSTISNIENGNRNATDHMIKSICRTFNVNEEWLRSGTGEMFSLPEDEVAVIVSNILENPNSKFYQILLNLARTYSELSPVSQEVLEEYAEKFVENIKKADAPAPAPLDTL